MIHFFVYQFPSILVWVFAVLNIRGFFKLRRAQRAAGMEVDVDGLTRLQVQVAMDASFATFTQRIEEMRRANHEHQ